MLQCLRAGAVAPVLCLRCAGSARSAFSALPRPPSLRGYSASSAASASASPPPAPARAPALGGMNNFFPPASPLGAPERSGRAWTAAELRLKGWPDLHGLWFVCLRERDMLTSDRLYHAQIGQSAPDGSRLRKVKLTMARIKVVLGERKRAAEAAAADAARLARLSPVDADKAAAASAVIAAHSARDASADTKLVTFKRFGRKYTVPASAAPEKPTRQQKRRAFKSRRFFANLRVRTDAVVAARGAIDAAAAAAGKVVEGPSKWGASAAPRPSVPAMRARDRR